MSYDSQAGFAVSALVALGGLIGFFKAGSIPSLVAGVGSGLAMAAGVQRAQRQYKDVTLVLAVSGLLILVMGRKFIRSGKFMPPGLVTLLSTGVFLRFGSRLL